MVKKQKTRKWKQSLLLGLLVIFALFGCGQAEQIQPAEEHTSHESNETGEKEASFPVTIKDGTGVEVTIDEQPTKIIALVPSVTESLFALGLGEKIVAVSDYSNYPEAATKKETIATFPAVDVEKITALEPDLIVADMINGQESIDALRKLGFPVIVSNATSIESVMESVEMFALATGTVEKGKEIVSQMTKELEEVEKIVSTIPDEERVSVWVEVDPEGLYTWGKGTFFNDMITAAGGKNIAADYESWDPYSSEKVIEQNPQVILATYGTDNVQGTIDMIQSRPGWNKIDAVLKNRIYTLDMDKTNRPAPRITQGLLDMVKALYPDKF